MTQDIPENPGKILSKVFLEPRGLTVNAISKKMGITQNRLYNIISGKVGITPSVAIYLSRFFEVPPEIFMSMQATYSLAMAKKKIEEKETGNKGG